MRSQHNIDAMAGYCRDRGVQWRPHAKAFKCPAIAHILHKAGAIGVTVAKVSEAEVMAAGGITDILIAHLVVGPSKVARLAALQKQADVKVTVDHPDHVAELSRAAQAAGVTIGVLVDVDIGMKRTGVATAKDGCRALPAGFSQPRLAVRRTDGLRGAYPHDRRPGRKTGGHRRRQSASSRRRATSSRRPAIACRIISAGGSGSYQYTADIAGITEIQAGGGIFACQYYTRMCQVQGHLPAIRVLASVVSRPAGDRAILDIGQKSISQHQTPPVFETIQTAASPGFRQSTPRSRSIRRTACQLEKRCRSLPGYSDFTFVLHDRVLGFRGGRVEAVWDLLGRGKLQ